MYVSINKQLVARQNASTYYLGSARERARRRFPVSKDPAGNMLPVSDGLCALVSTTSTAPPTLCTVHN